MELLESLNKLEKENYYDKEIWEEDKPYEGIPIDIHKKFEQLEEKYFKICNNIDITIASVDLI
jgi:hypothetical protein